jgi:RND superfamily putative drug exporter
LLLLAWQATRLDTSVPRGDWLPQAAESVHALHTLEQMDRAGVVQSLRVIVELPTDSIAQTDAGWNAIDRSPSARERPSLRPRDLDHHDCGGQPVSLSDLSRETRRTFLSSDGRAALLEVLPKTSVSLRDQVNWVRELRKTGAAALTGVPGATLRLGASRHSTPIIRRLSATTLCR